MLIRVYNALILNAVLNYGNPKHTNKNSLILMMVRMPHLPKAN